MTARKKPRAAEDAAAGADPAADADHLDHVHTKPEDDKTTTDDVPDTVAVFERGEVTTSITFCGTKFTFPTSQSKWPTRALQLFQRKENVDGIELLLGPAQWELFNTVAPLAEQFWQFWGIFLGVVNSTDDDDEDD